MIKQFNPLMAIRRSVIALVLVAVLSSVAPAPARAQDSVFNPLEWVTNLVSWLEEYQHILTQMAAVAAKVLGAAIHDAVPTATQAVKTNIEVASAQGEVDSERRTVEMNVASDEKSTTMLPTQTQACQIVHASQDAAVAADITGQAVTKLSDISTGRGAGTAGDTNSVSYGAAAANDRCKLGLLDTSGNGVFGLLPQTLGCTTPTDPHFIDADTRLSSVIGPLQYPLPAAAHANASRPDGYLSFIGSTTTETAPGLGSEVDYAAAYKFCENLQTKLSTPTHHGGTPTPADIASIRADRNDVSLRTAAADECFRALAYRTSCPAGSSTSLEAGGGANCHEAQAQLCAWLKSPHQAGGMELKMEGSDPVYKAALLNCDNEGMSQAMYDAIMAHRCEDRNYAFRVLPVIVGEGPELERVRAFDCPAMVSDYSTKMDREEQRLTESIQNLNLLRGTATGGIAQTTRLVP